MKHVESLAKNLYPKQTEAIPSLTEILKFFFRNRNIALKLLNFQGDYLQKKLWTLLSMKHVSSIDIEVIRTVFNFIFFTKKILSI